MTDVVVLTTVHNVLDTRIFHKEAVSLSDAGYDVTVLGHHERAEARDGIQVESLGTVDSKLDRWRNLPSVYREAKALNADVYHIHDPELLPIGAALQRSTESEVVYDAHENFHASILGKKWLPSAARGTVATSFDIVEAQLVKWFDGIITASDDIRTRFGHHDNVTTIPNYPLKHWVRDIEDTTSRSTIQVVYCGKITRQRAIPVLIEAIKILSQYHDVELVLGGSYTTNEIERYVKREADAHQCVSAVGWLPSIEDVIDLFHESDIGVMMVKPNNENQIYGAQRSNKIFQYMSTGTPILGADVGNWPEYIEEEDCGICVDTEHISSIVDGLKGLIEDPDRRTEMGKNGQAAVRREYNWEEQERELLDFYRRLLR